MQPYRPMASSSPIDTLLQSTNYGSYAIEVKYQVDDLLNRVKDSFQPTLEEQFYSGMKMNLIVLNGRISAFVGGVQCQFPVKILLPSGFPSIPPKVFLQPDSQSKLVSTSYLQGAEVVLSAVVKWAFNPQYRQYNTTLYHIIYYLSIKFGTEPPLTRNAAPSHPGMQTSSQTRYTPSQAMAGQSSQMASSMYVNSSEGYQNQRAGGYQPQPVSVVSAAPPAVGGKSQKEKLVERLEEKSERKSNLVKNMSKQLEQEATNYMKNLAEVKMRLEMNRDSLKLAKEELKNQCTELENEIKTVSEKNENTEIYLSGHNNVEIGEDNIDTVVFPKDEVSRRMLKQISKEQAIDDTLSVLTKGVAQESISHDDYLTAVRNVTMKQFYCVLKKRHLFPALDQKRHMMI